MQTWSRRPMQCVFCAFRQSQSSSRPPRQIRNSTSSAANAHLSRAQKKELRKREEEERHKGYEDTKFSIRRPVVGGRFTIRRTNGNPLRDHDKAAADEEFLSDVLPAAIERSLKTLHTRLTSRKVTGDDEHTEMQQLDPQGKSWPAYRAYIASLSKKMSESGSGNFTEKATWELLARGLRRSKNDLTTELYFGFLDFAVKPMNTNELRDAASLAIDVRYPTEWYSAARKSQRVIHLHVGPTNSGKTYNALKRLQETKNGFYAGPLRLLAHEVYSRFRANGIACDLITGDDIRYDDDESTKVYASTVEMVSTGREVDVAVIDEIQMMGNEERGWAWTRAVLGAAAKEVHLCGETRVVPLIRELAASMGDTLKIHHYERLNPLRCMSKSLRGNLKLLRKGDCIVAFSIMQIHALKKQIELETGKRCAIVYGGLPPETRAEQADFFNNPDNDYDFLVASDAIGMGLNLSVKRIIFNSVNKYDGTKNVQLTIPQIKQIAGRAGRFRSAHQDKSKAKTPDPNDFNEENVGLVTCLDERDLPVIRAALNAEAPPLRKAGIIPPAEYLEEYSTRLPAGVPFEYLMRKVCHSATIHPRFFLCDIRDKLQLARLTDEIPGLTIEQRVTITAAPAGYRDPVMHNTLKALCRVIAGNNATTVADIPEIPLEILAEEPRPDRNYLESLESLHKCLILYLWLSYRFFTNLKDQPMAIHAKELTEQKINWTLRAFSANPKLRQRLRQMRKEGEKLDAAHFSTGLPETAVEASAEVMDPDVTISAEVFEQENEQPKQQQEEEVPEHETGRIRLDDGEESLSEHFAKPAEILEHQNRQTEELDSDPNHRYEQTHASLAHSDQSPSKDSAEAVGVVNGIIAEDLAPLETDEKPTEHQFAERVNDEALMTPLEEAVIDKQMQDVDKLQPDPADLRPEDSGKGEVPTAKGKNAEILQKKDTEQDEDVERPMSASGSA